TGGLDGEVPYLILNVGEKEAEAAFLWWKTQFGDDFYAEIQRHGLPEEDRVNETLLKFCKKHDVKYFASNNVYYSERKEADAHDILLCVKQGEKQAQPKDFFLRGRSRKRRFGFPNDEFYFKSAEEMNAIFYDLPEALEETNKIADKIEPYKLQRDVLLPKFDIPAEFENEDDYLRHITYEGAKERYGEITDEIRERLDFELATIKNTGYPGYFLIVQDFTSQAREMGVSVGPGRGSAAGSAVAYCIGITNVDPIAYDLLFERFLNPDRVSLPDIDIDFDDRGRDRIIEWVVNKYGYNQVAQIITYGTMAAKSSIRDTARVLDLPLSDSDRLAKLVPDLKLKKLFGMDREALEAKLNREQLELADRLIEISQGNDLEAETVNKARILEGSVRNTGIHACGVIITPSDIRDHVPVATAKDADLLVTQFDNSVVEDAGMLKMDFLGLKTLTIIKDAIAMIQKNHGVTIVEDDIPLDDPETYELYQKGKTNGTFQFESPGMQKHLRALKPDKFEDLIAMNALYRPGPLEYIPNFIARKHGDEAITYDIDDMSEYLSNTYGITVYQEQVMLLSQKLAGFTKGQADALRKGMGKKKKKIIDELRPKFFEGCEKNGYDLTKVEKIWKDWEAFASYAFNKSHSTCYSVVAFHTMYLKAHYAPEYMASVLTHNMSDISKVTFFIDECKSLGIPVLGPDVNESQTAFTANKKGEIRFGLGAIKGAGGVAVQTIIDEREENGVFKDAFDFVERINLKAVNKKTFESLILAGAFDNCDTTHRAQYFHQPMSSDYQNFELVMKYGAKKQQEKESAQVSMFGAASGVEEPRPKLEDCEPWSSIEKLKRERDVVGFYISGHPLDQYKLLINQKTNADLSDWQDKKGKQLTLAGIITSSQHRLSKKGNKFGVITLEDYKSSLDMMFFGQDYLKNTHLLQEGEFVLIEGKVEERYNSPGQWEFRPREVKLLSEMKDAKVSMVKLFLKAELLSSDIIDELESLAQDHEGDCEFKFEVQFEQEKAKLPLTSAYKVQPTPQLLDAFEGMRLRYEVV
ncbi:MAG: DNA polymerase III subunit alpha, partial [Bacteroidota bacterium]